jgi:hypothetical protein
MVGCGGAHHWSVCKVEGERGRGSRARRALAAVALLILAVSYLPDAYGAEPAMTPRFHPVTLAIFGGAVLTGIATFLNSRREPLWNGYDRTKLRGLTLIALALPAVACALYLAAAVWSGIRISHWDKFYCNVSRFPNHRATCIANMTQWTNGFRDGARAALWFVVARAVAREAERPTRHDQGHSR